MSGEMKRNNSFDFLRSLCMLFVVIIHALGHSDILSNLESAGGVHSYII